MIHSCVFPPSGGIFLMFEQFRDQLRWSSYASMGKGAKVVDGDDDLITRAKRWNNICASSSILPATSSSCKTWKQKGSVDWHQPLICFLFPTLDSSTRFDFYCLLVETKCSLLRYPGGLLVNHVMTKCSITTASRHQQDTLLFCLSWSRSLRSLLT